MAGKMRPRVGGVDVVLTRLLNGLGVRPQRRNKEAGDFLLKTAGGGREGKDNRSARRKALSTTTTTNPRPFQHAATGWVVKLVKEYSSIISVGKKKRRVQSIPSSTFFATVLVRPVSGVYSDPERKMRGRGGGTVRRGAFLFYPLQ